MNNPIIEHISKVYNAYKFAKFLNELGDSHNQRLLESIFEGYSAIFEYPHVMLKDDTGVDLYVEKAMPSKEESLANIQKQLTKALGYINRLIASLEYDATIRVPEKYLRHPDETNIIPAPQETIDYPPVSHILDYLKKEADIVEQKLSELRSQFNQ